MVFSRIDSGRIPSHSANNCWRAIARRHQHPRTPPPPGTAPTAALRCLSFTDSLLWNSRGALTSILPDAADNSLPPTCSPHAGAFVCLPFTESPSGSFQCPLFRAIHGTSTPSSDRIPIFPALFSRSPQLAPVQKQHSFPIVSVRRKRQRLPSSLLIENASVGDFLPLINVRRGVSDQG